MLIMLCTYCHDVLPFLSLASMREGRAISSSVLCAGAGRGPALVIMSAGAGRVPRLCPLSQIRSGHHIITRTLDTGPSHFSQPATQLMSLMAWLARNKNFILLIYNSMSVVTPWYKRSEVKGR